MGIRFQCDECGKKLHVKEFLAGKRAICPKCSASIEIPKQSTIEPKESREAASKSGAGAANPGGASPVAAEPANASSDDKAVKPQRSARDRTTPKRRPGRAAPESKPDGPSRAAEAVAGNVVAEPGPAIPSGSPAPTTPAPSTPVPSPTASGATVSGLPPDIPATTAIESSQASTLHASNNPNVTIPNTAIPNEGIPNPAASTRPAAAPIAGTSSGANVVAGSGQLTDSFPGSSESHSDDGRMTFASARSDSNPAPPVPGAVDPIEEAPDAVWYVRPPAGGQYGPAAGHLLKRWIEEGRVSPNSLLWREGWEDWLIAAQAFPELVPTPPGDGSETNAVVSPESMAGSPTPSHNEAKVDESASKVLAYRRKRARSGLWTVAAIVFLSLIVVGLSIVLFLMFTK